MLRGKGDGKGAGSCQLGNVERTEDGIETYRVQGKSSAFHSDCFVIVKTADPAVHKPASILTFGRDAAQSLRETPRTPPLIWASRGRS